MAIKNEQNAQNEQAQTSPEEQKDALVCLDKTTNQYGVVTGMDENTGQMEWEAPNKDNTPPSKMLEIPTNTWLGKFFDSFVKQYGPYCSLCERVATNREPECKPRFPV